MRGNRGMVGIALLWLLVGISSLAFTALQIARWQKSRTTSETAEIQSRLLIMGASLLARETQFQFLERTAQFNSGTVDMVRHNSMEPNITVLQCKSSVGSFRKQLNVGWKKNPAGWVLDYWAES